MERTEDFWDNLLDLIDQRKVIPVVGPDLLTLPENTEQTTLYAYLAKRLADRLAVSSDGLPQGDKLNEVACRHLAQGGLLSAIYSTLYSVAKDLGKFPVPVPLLQLAEIRPFKLFVTNTFDSFLPRALNQVRSGGRPETTVISYAPNDLRDLPKDYGYADEPIVYHLLGKLASTPSYAVTQEDVVEFLHALQSGTRTPELLFDRLKENSLLILGNRFGDWGTRIFMRISKGQRLSTSNNTDYLAEDSAAKQNDLLGFLRHFSRGTKIYTGPGAVEFVNELSRRWKERNSAAEDVQAPRRELDESLDKGFVFVSYASEDRCAAEKIKRSLEETGISVFFDSDPGRLLPGEDWDRKLQRRVSECSVFLPIISKQAKTGGSRRYFRSEWRQALVEMKYRPFSGERAFLCPVLIDDIPDNDADVPGEFWAVQCTRMPGGDLSAEFVRRVRELYRKFQKSGTATL